MTQKRKKLVANIAFYTIIALIYGFVIFQVIVKFNGGVVYLFGVRYDVVLTDSMSSKNDNHLDFLEGTEQIQPYDVVRSKKIDDKTELKLKDVVLFNSPELGGKTVMHRIAEIVQHYDTLGIYNCEQVSFNEINTIKVNDYNSFMSLSNQSLKSIEIEYLSNEDIDSPFMFNFGGKYVNGERTSIKVDGYYRHHVIGLSESVAEMPSRIYPKVLNESYITKVKYTTNFDVEFEFTADNYVKSADDLYETHVNVVDYYKLRGDKAKDFDNSGKEFSRSSLISKVENKIPKLGYVISFLRSIPGIIMLVGLAILITITSFLYNKLIDQKQKVVVADNLAIKNDDIDKETEKETEIKNED